jgi:hypothetical protein
MPVQHRGLRDGRLQIRPTANPQISFVASNRTAQHWQPMGPMNDVMPPYATRQTLYSK